MIEVQYSSNRRMSAHASSSQVRDLIVVALLVIMFLSACTFSIARQDTVDSDTSKITVRPGDTLWDIAERHGVSGRSTAETVRFIMAENDLEDASIAVGQSLSVPVESLNDSLAYNR